jgi:large subunit ribosomal protein L29
MRPEKIRELDTTELSGKTREAEEQMFRLRFQMSLGQMDGLKKLRALKKDRARMLTILKQREAAGETIAVAPLKAAGKTKKGK